MPVIPVPAARRFARQPVASDPTNWTDRSTATGVIYADNFNYANRAAMIAASLGEDGYVPYRSRIDLGTTNPRSGSGTLSMTIPAGEAPGGTTGFYLNGVDSTQYPEFYLQFSVYLPAEWVEFPHHDAGVPTGTKLLVIDQWDGTNENTEIVLNDDDQQGFVSIYRNSTVSADLRLQELVTTSDDGVEQRWQSAIDAGTPAGPWTLAQARSRYGYVTGSDTTVDEYTDNSERLPAQGIPVSAALTQGFEFKADTWHVFELYVRYEQGGGRIVLAGAYGDNAPVTIIDSEVDDEGGALLSPSPETGASGLWFTTFSGENPNDYAASVEYTVDFDEIITSTNPIIFPSGDPMPGIVPTYISTMTQSSINSLATADTEAQWDDVLPVEWASGGSDPGNGAEVELGWGDWSGGAADFDNRILYFHGGGHNQSAFNGIVGYDFSGDANPVGYHLETGSYSTVATTDTDDGVTYSDGRPVSRHTYSGCGFMSAVGDFFSCGGATYDEGFLNSELYIFDMSANSWSNRSPTGLGGNIIHAFYDPSEDVIIMLETNAFNYAVYDSSGSSVNTGTFGGNTARAQSAAAYDPVRQWALCSDGLAGGGSFFPNEGRIIYNPSTNVVTTADITVAGDSSWSQSNTGLIYDPDNACWWSWAPGLSGEANTLYHIEVTQESPVVVTSTAYTLTGTAPTMAGVNWNGNYDRGIKLKDWPALGFFFQRNINAYIVKLPTGFS